MKRIIVLTVGLFLILALVSCGPAETPQPQEPEEQAPQEETLDPITLATTTSTENSGLLDYILPHFEEKYNTKVNVAGGYRAMEMGKRRCGRFACSCGGYRNQFVNDGTAWTGTGQVQ